MRIERVNAYAFGPFVDRTLELAPGMTVVCGPNEAGKSSWHAALYAGLCGMRRKPGRSGEDRQFAERHRPWDGDRWEVGVTVRLSDGRGVELRHNLANLTDCRASDTETGRDVSAEIMHENTPDGALYLGLTRRSLLPTVCVRQADLLAVLDNSEQLQEHLQRAASTGGTDEPAERAIRRLRDYHSTQVGLERQNSARPLMAAVRAVARAEQDLAVARDQHAAYLELVARRDRLAEAARTARDRRDAVLAAAAQARLAKLEGRVGRARELTAALAGEPPPQEADDPVAATVSHALAAFASRPDTPAPLGGHTAAELAEQLAALPPVPAGDTDVAPTVTVARRQWERAVTAVELHAQRRPSAVDGAPAVERSPTEVRRLAEDLDVPEPELPPDEGHGRGRAVAALVAASALAVAATGLLVAGRLLAGLAALAAAAGGGVAWLLLGRGGSAEVARRETARILHEQAAARRQRARTEAEGLGVEADAAALRELAAALESTERAAAELAGWQERAAALDAAAEQAATALRRLLAERGVSDDDDLADLVECYERDCRRRADQARQAGRRPELEEALAVRRAAEEAAAGVLRRREEAEDGLREAAAAAGVEADDLDALAAGLRRWQAERVAEERRAQQARDRWVELHALLDGRSLDEWEAELARQRAHLPSAPEGVEVAVDEDVEAQVRLLEREADDAQAEAKITEGAVRTVEQQLHSVAEAEEDLARARAEEERVRRLSETLTRTRAFLEVARDRVYRDVAPQLSTAVERALPTVTAGRYTQARVDPETLLVRVRTPGGDWREATGLSHGTSEQIYLLLRLAMAEHLVTTGEPAPLLLDDVTTQSDPVRSRAILDLLHEVSAERQVVVFSQEDIVLEWARERLVEPRDRLELLDAVPA